MNLSVLVLVVVFDCVLGRTNTVLKIRNETPKNHIISYNPRPPDITVPIMIHLDRPLAGNLTKQLQIRKAEKAKIYFRKVLKNVEKLFSHPSLNLNIEFLLLNVKILSNKTKMFKMDENVSKYLKSYCQWQGEKKIVKRKWYYSILFTGLDVYYLDRNNVEVRKSHGRGYQGGLCSLKHSCTLLEWHHKNIAYILAHEIAHSLGLYHDGPPNNQCRGQRYIMDAKYNTRNPATSWSPCNKRELKQFLMSRKAWCLRG